MYLHGDTAEHSVPSQPFICEFVKESVRFGDGVDLNLYSKYTWKCIYRR